MKIKDKKIKRWKRHCRIRKKVIGSEVRPRLAIYRSNKHIYCQLIDDNYKNKRGEYCSRTLVACSTLTPSITKEIPNGGNKKAAKIVGLKMAELAKEKNIEKVIFDRGGYKYHGRVKVLADAVREGGLIF